MGLKPTDLSTGDLWSGPPTEAPLGAEGLGCPATPAGHRSGWTPGLGPAGGMGDVPWPHGATPGVPTANKLAQLPKEPRPHGTGRAGCTAAARTHTVQAPASQSERDINAVCAGGERKTQRCRAWATARGHGCVLATRLGRVPLLCPSRVRAGRGVSAAKGRRDGQANARAGVKRAGESPAAFITCDGQRL